jgi:hypothetical protein
VTRRDKRLAAIRRNPKAIRFEEACKAAEHIGFVLRGGEGSHRVYGRDGEPTGVSPSWGRGSLPGRNYQSVG